ncbi:MAG: hypothetical protein J3R72DRAFT_62261 [Linnemannia gamsii]|nr:MAG: hypothetical protein J3R72DRAFT_62261 [Linnemannia gamsii]
MWLEPRRIIAVPSSFWMLLSAMNWKLSQKSHLLINSSFHKKYPNQQHHWHRHRYHQHFRRHHQNVKKSRRQSRVTQFTCTKRLCLLFTLRKSTILSRHNYPQCHQSHLSLHSRQLLLSLDKMSMVERQNFSISSPPTTQFSSYRHLYTAIVSSTSSSSHHLFESALSHHSYPNAQLVSFFISKADTTYNRPHPLSSTHPHP